MTRLSNGRLTTLITMLAVCAAPAPAQSPLGSEWTYHGRLTESGNPVEGTAAMRFWLYDAASGGNVVAGPVDRLNVPIAAGLFTVEVDFGVAAFGPDARWLEIEVRSTNSGSDCSDGTCFVLAPRQKVTAAPVALYALNGPPGGGSDDGDWTVTDVDGTGANDLFATLGGNVGIGTSTPFYKLHVVTTTIGDGVNLPGFRTFITATIPNVIGGDATNLANAGVTGATIAGGVNNRVSAVSGSIGGGSSNTAGAVAAIAGGLGNTASGLRSFIGAGYGNWSQGKHSVIAGGGRTSDADTTSGNTTYDDFAFIGGGGNNKAGSDDGNPATATYATIGGGLGNLATGAQSTVAGGQGNAASGFRSFIGGGHSNQASTTHATIAGGFNNDAQATGATVAGGEDNAVWDNLGVIAGGKQNTIGVAGGSFEEAAYGAIGGGEDNTVVAAHGAIVGGQNNQAGQFSFVGSGQGNVASGIASVIGGGGSNDATGAASTIAGGEGNQALANYAAIGGGGPVSEGQPGNRVYDEFGTIGGGGGNRAGNDDADTTSAPFATVAGGEDNRALASHGSIGGGVSNDAGGTAATVGGGYENSAGGSYSVIGGGYFNGASSTYSTVGGGFSNFAIGPSSIVGGGSANVAAGVAATIGGGGGNESDGNYSTVGGGDDNTTSGDNSTVGGGYLNAASGNHSTIGGGYENEATGLSSTIGGGYRNFASGTRAIVGGGDGNAAYGDSSYVGGGISNVASAYGSTVPGGGLNEAGGQFSLAAGRRAKVRPSPAGSPYGDYGTFVWADGTDADFVSTNPNQFLIRASGGVGVGTNAPYNQLTVAGDADFTGRVGIGTETPEWPLHVRANQGVIRIDSITDASPVIEFRNGGVTRGALNWLNGLGNVPGQISYFDDLFFSAYMSFRVAGLERMRIVRNGYVGIGTDAPTQLLSVNGSAGKPGGGSWSTFSDARLKQNIAPMTDALDRLLQLQGYEFEYTSDAIANERGLPGRQIGLIAQEVQRVFPDWVEQDADGYLFVTERATTALLVESLRELRAENDAELAAARAENEELRARLERLEARLDAISGQAKGDQPQPEFR